MVYDSGTTNTSLEAKQAAYEAGTAERELTSNPQVPLAESSNINYNKDADIAEYEKYKGVLGEEFTFGFNEFKNIKNEQADVYDELLERYEYKKKVPESSLLDFKYYKLVISTGMLGEIRVPPEDINVFKLQLKDEHAVNHGCNINDARDYVRNAKFSVVRRRWDGVHINYYSLDGATYIEKESGLIKTIFSNIDYDETVKKALGVLK